MYFIIEELPNPRDSGLFKILCVSTQIALDAVTLDESGVVIANQLIGLHAAAIRKYSYQRINFVNIALDGLGRPALGARIPRNDRPRRYVVFGLSRKAWQYGFAD